MSGSTCNNPPKIYPSRACNKSAYEKIRAQARTLIQSGKNFSFRAQTRNAISYEACMHRSLIFCQTLLLLLLLLPRIIKELFYFYFRVCDLRCSFSDYHSEPFFSRCGEFNLPTSLTIFIAGFHSPRERNNV